VSAEQPNQLPLENGDQLGEDSHEVARIWITSGAGSSVWIDAGVLDDPRVFGFLMADTVRHAALAYASTYGIPEEDALQAIADGIAEELREQFNEVTTIQKGSLS
jgi:hypothetical protein